MIAYFYIMSTSCAGGGKGADRMKRLVAQGLSVALAFLLCACGGGQTQGQGGGTPGASKTPETPAGGQMAVDIQREADTVVLTCTGDAVADFVKQAPNKEDNQFSVQFDGAGGGLYSVSFQYPSGDEEPMASWSNLAQEEHRSTWDKDGSIRFAVEGSTATWILSGLPLDTQDAKSVFVYAVVGDYGKPVFEQDIPMDEVRQSEGITDLPSDDLPFEIVGEYATWNEGTGNPRLIVEAVPGAYIMTYGDYVSAPTVPEVDGDLVTLSGTSAQGPADGAVNFYVRFGKELNGVSASLSIHELSDGGTRIDDSMRSFPIRPGVYRSLAYETEEIYNAMEMEYERGKFRFVIEDIYESDWLVPTEARTSQYTFADIPLTDRTGAKRGVLGEVCLVVRYDGSFTYANVSMKTDTEWLPTISAYSPIAPDYVFPFVGTYQPDPSAAEAHTIEVTETGLTVDGRYTVDYTPEDVMYKWRMFQLVDTVTGESQDAAVQLYELDDGSCFVSVNSYDGKLMAQAIRK